jgi:hypothetical protein
MSLRVSAFSLFDPELARLRDQLHEASARLQRLRQEHRSESIDYQIARPGFKLALASHGGICRLQGRQGVSEHQRELSPYADGFAEEVHYKRTQRLFGQSTVEVTRRRIPVEPSGPMVDAVEGLVRDVVHELTQYRLDLRFNQDRLIGVVRRELAEGLKTPALSRPAHITTADCVAIVLNKSLSGAQ